MRRWVIWTLSAILGNSFQSFNSYIRGTFVHILTFITTPNGDSPVLLLSLSPLPLLPGDAEGPAGEGDGNTEVEGKPAQQRCESAHLRPLFGRRLRSARLVSMTQRDASFCSARHRLPAVAVAASRAVRKSDSSISPRGERGRGASRRGSAGATAVMNTHVYFTRVAVGLWPDPRPRRLCGRPAKGGS